MGVCTVFSSLSEQKREKNSLMQHCLHAVKLVKMSNRSEGRGTLETKVQIRLFSLSFFSNRFCCAYSSDFPKINLIICSLSLFSQPDNILLDEKGHARLTDFNVATRANDKGERRIFFIKKILAMDCVFMCLGRRDGTLLKNLIHKIVQRFFGGK